MAQVKNLKVKRTKKMRRLLLKSSYQDGFLSLRANALQFLENFITTAKVFIHVRLMVAANN